MNLETISDPGCAEPELLIILVHGTWPHGLFPKLSRQKPCWFERSSDFVNSLEGCLRACQLFDKTRIYAFRWSGENSFLQRNAAAAALALILAEQKREFPKARQTIVAHSHGGNVALRAVYYLPSDSNAVDVATVATPFVEVRLLSWFSNTNPGGALLLGDETISSREFRTRHPWVYSIATALGPAKKHVQRARRLRLASRLTHLKHPHLTRLKRLFVLRAIDDEAALVLAAGAIGTRLSNITGRLLFIALVVTVALLMTVVFLVFSFLAGWEVVDPFDDRFVIVATIFTLLRYLPILGMLFWFAPRLFRTVYGREAFSVNCEINSHSVPDVVGVQTKVITLQQRQHRWKRRHMLYDAPESANLIVSWILQQS
jgi:hypothetical protein